MATLLCIPQFIALKFLAHTFASGHCLLRHARSGGALILPSMPPWKCSLCKWLFFYFFDPEWECLAASICIQWGCFNRCGCGLVGVALWLMTSLTDLVHVCRLLTGCYKTQHWTLKDPFTGPHQIYPVFNCIREQSLSALQILAKAELNNRVIIAGV